MKYRVCLAVCLLALLTTGAHAQHFDSLAVNYIVDSVGVPNPKFVEGNADGTNVQFSSSGFMDVGYWVNKQPLVFEKGSVLHLYWNRKTTDSSVANVQFFRLNPDSKPLGYSSKMRIFETTPVNQPGMASVTVPDTGFNDLYIEVAADTGAVTFWLDAVTILQSGFAAVQLPPSVRSTFLQNYPNPFVQPEGTTVSINVPHAGNGLLVLTDVAGREQQIALGPVTEGPLDVKVFPSSRGIYFVRLLLNGEVEGSPLKITAE